MAERRMFAKTIIDSDAFLDMPATTQTLYFHLSMRADDEGFVNNPKKIQRVVGSSDDDLKLLIAKKFIIPFESGIVVIKHWKIHNYIRKDRLQETVYQEEKGMLEEKENGSYTLCQSHVSQAVDKCQHRLGKDSIDKDICADKPALEQEVHNTYEQLWSMYPVKKGKARISLSQKKKLHSIGLEEMTRAINRYKKEIEGKDKQYIQHGSTFFNSGYVDYLDANYEQTKSTLKEVEIEW